MKQMNNKGFTLIELLAVIVILAIIALIATPIVLGLIEDAREGASERSVEYILKNVELAYSAAYLHDYESEGGTPAGFVPTIEEVASEFEMDGAAMDSTGKITAKDENITCETSVNGGLVIVCHITDNDNEYKTSMTMQLAN